MPIYEFKCNACGDEFEEIVFSDNDAVTCPKCSSAEVGRLMSRCGFKTAGGAPAASGDEDAAPAPQYRGIGSGNSGCSGCSGGDCSSCG